MRMGFKRDFGEVGKKSFKVVFSLALLMGIAPVLQGCFGSANQSTQLASVSVTPKSNFALDSETATITLKTDAQLAENIGAGNITLSGKFDDYSIESVNRDNDSTLSIVLKAAAPAQSDDETRVPDGSEVDDPTAFDPRTEEDQKYWDAVHAGTAGDDGCRFVAQICYGVSAPKVFSANSANSANSEQSASSASGSDGNVVYDLHEDETAGGIYLSAATFDNCNRGASVVIDVVKAIGSLHPENGSWDSDKGEILLPFDLGEAEFNAQPRPSDVLISDPNIKITAIDLDSENKNAAVLHIEAPADKVQALVPQLDKALTESGLSVSGAVTNTGDVPVTSEAVENAKAEGKTVTALECIAPNVTATIKNVSINDSELSDKSDSKTVDVNMDTEFSASVGSIDFSRSSTDQVGTVTKTDGTMDVLKPEVNRTGATTARLTDTEDRVYIDLKADDLVCDTEAEAKQAASEAAEIANAHVIKMASGVVLDGWGVPRDDVEAYVSYDSDSTSGSSDSNNKKASLENDAKSLSIVKTAYADDESTHVDEKTKQRYEDAEKTLKAIQEILEAAGDVSEYITSPAEQKSLITSGLKTAGSVVGMAAEFTGLAAPTGASVQDVFNEVVNVDKKISELQAEIPALSTQLTAVQKDLAYREDLRSLAPWSIQAANLQKIENDYYGSEQFSDFDKTLQYITDGSYAKDLEAIQAESAAQSNSAGTSTAAPVAQSNGADSSAAAPAAQSNGASSSAASPTAQTNSGSSSAAAAAKTNDAATAASSSAAAPAPQSNEADQSAEAVRAQNVANAKSLESYYKKLLAEDNSKNLQAITLMEYLGNAISGNSSLFQSSAIDDCFDYIDTTYNWEPETYADKKAFMAYIGRLYLSAYLAAYFENTYGYAVEKTVDQDTFEANCSKIKDSFDSVKGVFGLGADGSQAESSQQAKTHSKDSSKVKNLVNGKSYSPSTFGKSIFGSAGDYINWIERDPRDTKNPPNMDVTISTANFQSMAERRKTNSYLSATYSNLWEEMKAMGLGVSYPDAFNVGWKSYDINRSYSSTSSSSNGPNGDWSRVYFLTDSDLTFSHEDKSSVYHNGTWTGDSYDVVNERAVTNGDVMYQHYYFDWYWRTISALYIKFNTPSA